MKIKIDKNGFLHIERAGKFKLQLCKQGIKITNLYCGDYFECQNQDYSHVYVQDPHTYTYSVVYTSPFYSLAPCGDWCPNFYIEPEKIKYINETPVEPIIISYDLYLCNGIISIDPKNLIDERPKSENNRRENKK